MAIMAAYHSRIGAHYYNQYRRSAPLSMERLLCSQCRLTLEEKFIPPDLPAELDIIHCNQIVTNFFLSSAGQVGDKGPEIRVFQVISILYL